MLKTTFRTGLALLVFIFLNGCNNPSGDLPISGAISDANDAKVALSTLQQYSDTASIAWKELDQADSVKMADIARLVLEFSYGTAAPKELGELQRLLVEAQTAKLRFDDQFNASALQRYDAITDTLTDKTLKLNTKLKLANKFKPMMGQLADAIDQDENVVIVKRAMYDEAASKYNAYFTQKKSVIAQVDSAVASKPNRAYFPSANPI